MKVPLVYPKIPDTRYCQLTKCLAFEKYDGTNLHWVWRQEEGWVGFGTRRSRYSLNTEGIAEFQREHQPLRAATDLFEEIVKPTSNYLLSAKYSKSKELIVFTEFFGANSFAGAHVDDEPKTLMVIDVLTDFGFLNPDQFVIDWGCGMYLPEKNFPRILCGGKYSGQMVEDIRNNKYNVKEGAIIKGMVRDKVHMFKVKTNEYMERLKAKLGSKWQDHWE
jgi:hypothetical protein